MLPRREGGEDTASRKKAAKQVLPGVSFRELLTLPVEELREAESASVGEALARAAVSEALDGDHRALGFVTQAVLQEMAPEENGKKGKDFVIEVRILE